MIPGARVGHIGLQRDEITAIASQYYAKLPTRLDRAVVVMIDPMLATGGSAVAALDLLIRAGARDIRMICIVAAPEGVRLVERHLRKSSDATSPEQRAGFEDKLSVVRRLILACAIAILAAVGYWLGNILGGLGGPRG